jgi:hypothetical protein
VPKAPWMGEQQTTGKHANNNKYIMTSFAIFMLRQKYILTPSQ